jgi:hypothetical protein
MPGKRISLAEAAKCGIDDNDRRIIALDVLSKV